MDTNTIASEASQAQESLKGDRAGMTVKTTQDGLSSQITPRKPESNEGNTFCSLAQEIIGHILAYLDYSSSCNLRLSCQDFRTKSLYAFKNKYCTTKTIDFWDSSLEFTKITLKARRSSTRRHTLDDLEKWSNHDFGSSIKTIRFKPFHANNLERISYDEIQHELGPTVNNFGNHLIESKRLAKIFSRLSNLHEVEVLDKEQDFEDRICWCRSCILGPGRTQTVAISMQVVLSAAAESNTSLSKLTMENWIKQKLYDGVRLQDFLPAQQNLSAFANLRFLELFLTPDPPSDGNTPFALNVPQFLSATPALEVLNLNCWPQDPWLKSVGVLIMKELSKEYSLQSLHSIRLYDLCFESTDFVQFVKNHSSTLLCLELSGCGIELTGGMKSSAGFIDTLEGLKKTSNLGNFKFSDLFCSPWSNTVIDSSGV